MPTPGNCKNCDTPMRGAFCHRCGQRELDLQRPIVTLLRESVQETFDVDGRLARTLFTLLARPGVMSRSYLNGRRQEFTPPLRLYLVVSVLFFLFVGWLARQGFLFELTPNTTDEVQVLAEHLPRVMFLCLPIFALFLKILHSRHYFFDHLIHALHIHTAAYITLVLLLPFERIAQESWVLLAIQILVFGYMVIYLVVSQREVYGGSWAAAVAKTGVLFFCYTVLLAVSLEIANGLEAAGGITQLW